MTKPTHQQRKKREGRRDRGRRQSVSKQPPEARTLNFGRRIPILASFNLRLLVLPVLFSHVLATASVISIRLSSSLREENRDTSLWRKCEEEEGRSFRRHWSDLAFLSTSIPSIIVIIIKIESWRALLHELLKVFFWRMVGDRSKHAPLCTHLFNNVDEIEEMRMIGSRWMETGFVDGWDFFFFFF